jgi:predicted 2-oxoglutarate/Fe(II)-dependent dioxygenase YbiX
MDKLADYIITLDKVIPDDLCNAVLNEYKLSPDWVQAPVSGGTNTAIRNCKTISISQSAILNKNLDFRQKLDQELFSCASKTIREYNNRFSQSVIQEDSGYELLEYSEGGFYAEHIDSFKARPRSVSCSFALNDEYTGGEFAFFGGELQVQIPKGTALMFPSNFMYPHQILPVTSGVRYSIVTWFI